MNRKRRGLSNRASVIAAAFLVLALVCLQLPQVAAALGTEDFVDATSNLHDPTDIGTHSAFAEMQDFDLTYNILTEADTSGSYSKTHDYVDSTSNLHAPPDFGTHSSFAELQDYDTVYDTLTEADNGTAPTNIHDYVDAISDLHAPTDFGTHSLFANLQAVDSAFDTLTEVDNDSSTGTFGDTSGSGTSYYTPTTGQVYLGVFSSSVSGYVTGCAFYGRGSSSTVNVKSMVTSSTGIILANGISNVLSVTTTAGIKTTVYSGGSQPFVTSGTTYWIGFVASGSLRIYYDATTGATSRYDSTNDYTTPTNPSDAVAGTVNWRRCYANVAIISYGMDLEVGWTAADYDETNEELCILAGSQDSEACRVDVWNGAGWAQVVADVVASAWNNVSISSYLTDATFEIRFRDSATGEYVQGSWQFDAVVLHCWSAGTTNYALDLEVGWTAADYDEVNEYLCLYGGTQDAEALKVDIWYSSAWVNIIADVSAGWNNISISGYLTGSAVEVRFLDATKSSDVSQGAWQVEAVLVVTWTVPVNYNLDLEVGWTAADFDETNEYLCIYGGTQDDEALQVDIWTGSWTSVLGDVSAGWNNISIHSYLDDATVEIRFVDTVADASQGVWNVDAVLVHTWTVSNPVPTNDTAPYCDNLDDTDNLYARYKLYVFYSSVQDTSGYSDIDYVELSCYSGSALWTVRFDEDTHAFTEEAGASFIALDASSTHSHSGNDLDVTWYVYVEWAHTDVADYDLRQYVIDSVAGSDQDDYDLNYDYETRLDFNVGPSLNDGLGTATRGPISASDITASGNINYYGGAVHPLTATVDVWISSTIAGGPWEATYADDGSMGKTGLPSDTAPDSDDFTFKVVQQGAGSGGTDECHTTHSAAYISDRINVASMSMLDGRINVDDIATVRVFLQYAHDSSAVQTGSFTVSGHAMSWFSGDEWRALDSESTVTRVDYTTVSGQDATHGIDVIQNTPATYCIWDIVYGSVDLAANDSRLNIDVYAAITVTLLFDYDETAVTTGTVIIEGFTATHLGSGVWRIERTSAAVTIVTYDEVTSTGNAYGITLIQDYGSCSVIWDRIEIYYEALDDSRVNYNSAIEYRVRARLDYDDHELVTDDSLTCNDGALMWDAVNAWFDRQKTLGSVGDYIFQLVSGSEATYGITTIYIGVSEPTGVWDRIYGFVDWAASDTRVKVSSGSNITVTLRLDYDEAAVTTGTLTIAFGYTLIHCGGGTWYAIVSSGTVQMLSWSTITASGTPYGITLVEDVENVNVIWDLIHASVTLAANDTRDNIGDNVGITITVTYDYDEVPVTTGTLTIEGLSATHVAAGQWRIVENYGTVGAHLYDDAYSAGDTYGLDGPVDTPGSVTVIWDRIYGYIDLGANDTRDDINDYVRISVTLLYDYDEASVTTGTVTIEGYTATYGDSGVWYIDRTSAAVTSVTYDAVAVSGDTYGITTVQDCGSVQVIWDRVLVTLQQPTYWKLPYGVMPSDYVVSAVYDFDDAPYTGAYMWNDTLPKYEDGTFGYQVTGASDTIYDLTEAYSTGDFYVMYQTISGQTIREWLMVTETYWWARNYADDLAWSIEGAMQNGVPFCLYWNSTLVGNETSESQEVGPFWSSFDSPSRYITWYWVMNYVSAPYNFSNFAFYSFGEAVPVTHTIHPDVTLAWTDLYLYVTWYTNWHNASIYLWSNVTTLLGSSEYEGVTQIVLPSDIGFYTFDMLVNGSSPHSGTNDGTYPTSDYWYWYHLNYTVSVSDLVTMHFYFYMNDTSPIWWPIGFKVICDGNRLDEPKYTTAASTINLTIADLWDYIVYQNTSYPVAEFCDIPLQVFYLTLWNLKPYGCNVSITFNSHTYWFYVGPSASRDIRVVGGTYTVYWYADDVPVPTQTDPVLPVTKDTISKTLPPTPIENNGGYQSFNIDIWTAVGIVIVVAVLCVLFATVWPFVVKSRIK